MPSFYSWEEVLESPSDFSFNSTVVYSRDHHNPAGNLTWPNPNAYLGQSQMTEAVEMWLPTPGTSNSNQTFAQWCWSTQIFQSMTITAQIAFYRGGAGRPEKNMGTLVWQLNDVWQGTSWSAIEYSGRWKVMNYGLASVYNSIIINALYLDANQSLWINATSDLWQETQATAEYTWYNWAGKALQSTTKHVTIPSLNNAVVYKANGMSTFLPPGQKAIDVFLFLSISSTVNGKKLYNEQYVRPRPLLRP
jgi:beta-mannosidase